MDRVFSHRLSIMAATVDTVIDAIVTMFAAVRGIIPISVAGANGFAIDIVSMNEVSKAGPQDRPFLHSCRI